MLLSGLASAGALIVLGLLFACPQLGIVALPVLLAVVLSLSPCAWLALVRDRIEETYHRGSVVPWVGCVELRSLSRGPCG